MIAPESIIRFLIAREYNLEKSLDMFQKSVQWRLEYKPHEITPESVRAGLESHRLIIYGFDKKGRSTLILRPRYHTPGEFEIDLMLRYGIFMVEKAIRLARANGNNNFVVILDR